MRGFYRGTLFRQTEKFLKFYLPKVLRRIRILWNDVWDPGAGKTSMNSPTHPRSRMVAIFAGRVQGVGFRATTRHLASSLPVTGYVKNLSDGTVQLVADGERADLEKLLLEIRGELGGLISGTEILWEAAREEFRSFEIRR